jgi:proline iminopeptidase
LRVRVHDTDLYVDTAGSQLHPDGERLIERPAMLILHGGPGFDQGYLRPGLRPLAELAQLVFVDLRRQGRSGQPPVDTCTLEQMADDVAAVSDVLGLVRPLLFGHSAGGFVALHTAIRHPDLMAGLILCDTSPTMAPLPDDDPPAALIDRAGPEAVAVTQRLFGGDLSAGTMEAFNRLVAPFYAAPDHMDVPGRLFPLSSFATDVAEHFFGRLAARYDVRDRLAAIRVPTLVIAGAYDWVCPPVASRSMARQIPDARLVEIDNAGHFPFSEEPEAFTAAVAEFVASTVH